jgi:integrase
MPSPVTIRRGYMPEGDLVRFLQQSHDERELLWWLLMCDAGLRLGEVKSLRYRDIEGRAVRVRGKGRKVRLVPITKRILRTSEAVKARYFVKEDDLVCPLGSRTVQRRFEVCLLRAKIRKEKLCPHSLRHTFATRLLSAGVDIHRVGVLLGHSSTLTTVGYLHTNEDALREACERLDTLNDTGRPPSGSGGEQREGGGGSVPPPSCGPPSRPYSEIGDLVGGGMASEPSPPPSGKVPRPSPLDRVSDLLL